MNHPKFPTCISAFGLIFLATTLLCSCKKNYTCNCSGSGLNAHEQKRALGKMKKTDAEEACDGFEAMYKMRSSDVNCSVSK